MQYEHILFSKASGIARITINRPDVLNAFNSQTVTELVDAFADAGSDQAVGVIVFGGAGERAFSAGGDQTSRGPGVSGMVKGSRAEELHSIIRDVPQPVIARVQGYAIGGGNVLAVLCDLTIASERAVFGQVGPRVGSVDPGFGTAYLAHIVGEKKAREMWYLCRRYSAEEALRMGLCNAVVPHDQLDHEIDQWCAEMLAMSPTALTIAKRSFNANTESIRGIGELGRQAVKLYYQTAEAKEGSRAFLEKRKPDFRNPPK